MTDRHCPECDCRECADCVCSFFHAERDALRHQVTRLTVELAALKRSDSGRDEEVRRMADVCWDHFETYGTWPLWATEQLVNLIRSKP